MGDEDIEKLPDSWKKKESRSKPGKYYYANLRTGASVWKLEDVYKTDKADLQADQQSKHKYDTKSKQPTDIHRSIAQEPLQIEKTMISSERTNRDFNAKVQHAGKKIRSNTKSRQISPTKSRRSKQNVFNPSNKLHAASLSQTIAKLKSAKQAKHTSATSIKALHSTNYVRVTKSTGDQKDNAIAILNDSTKSNTKQKKTYKKVEDLEDQFEKIAEKSWIASASKSLLDDETVASAPSGTKSKSASRKSLPFQIKSISQRYTPFTIKSRESLRNPERTASDRKLPNTTMMDKKPRMPELTKLETNIKALTPKPVKKTLANYKIPKVNLQHISTSPVSHVRNLSPTSQYLASTDPLNTEHNNPPVTFITSPTSTVKRVVSTLTKPTQIEGFTQAQAAVDTAEVSHVAINDWDMLSDDDDEGESSNDLLVSFSLTSDIVMASMSQDDISLSQESSPGVQNTSSDNQYQSPEITLVMDTCVLGHLKTLLQYHYTRFKDESEEKLYYIQKILIPWQALQEIDVLKDNKQNKFSTNKQRGAQSSVDYFDNILKEPVKNRKIAKLLHQELKDKKSRIKLQSPLDDASDYTGFRIQTPDDQILKCCLSLKKKLGKDSPHQISLLTSDINLINKSLACEVQAVIYEDLVLVSANREPIKSYNQRECVKLPPKPSSHPLSKEAHTPLRAVVRPLRSPDHCTLHSEAENKEENHSLIEDIASFSSLARGTVEVTSHTAEEEKKIFEMLEESLLPLLSRCLALEMCEVYSEIWQTIVYKKPPWQSLTPVLESINKHWIAVFGIVLGRATKESIETLLHAVTTTSRCSTRLSDALVAAVAVVRALDQAKRSYAADTCQVLNKLNDLVAQTEGEGSNDSKEEITAELTKIFSRLAAECATLNGPDIMSGIEVVMSLGQKYQAAMAEPVDSSLVRDFLDEINSLAAKMSIQVNISLSNLSYFIKSHRHVMTEGLSQLEELAVNLQQRL